MIPSRRLPLALASLALASLVLGLALPPPWQGLPAVAAALLLTLATLERLQPRWRWAGLWQHPPAPPGVGRARRRQTTLHLLIDSRAPAGRITWRQNRDQALGFANSLTAGGNVVRLYGLDPDLRLLSASTLDRALPMIIEREGSASGDLKAAVAQLCRKASPGSLIVIMTPLEDTSLNWLTRLELSRRSLTLWLVDTSSPGMTEPVNVRGRHGARAYAEAWQAEIHHARLAARLERLGIVVLSADGKASLQTRLLRLWDTADEAQTAD